MNQQNPQQDPNQYQQNYQNYQMPPPMDQAGQQQPMGGPQYPQGGQPGGGGAGMIDERTHIEEIAEAIIDEKWQELVKNLNKLTEWKDKTDDTISKLKQELEDVRTSFDKLHKAIIGKIGEYDQNILNVGTEIKAMERVFQKILPTFTENVNELSRITAKAKGAFGASDEEGKKKKQGGSEGTPHQHSHHEGTQ